MYHEYANGTQRKHYNGQRLGTVMIPASDYTDPDSPFWKREAEKAMAAFDALPIPADDWNTFQSFIPDELTWKEAHRIYSQAAATWKLGLTIEAVAYECGILPDERNRQ
jgi:hypothetical protein